MANGAEDVGTADRAGPAAALTSNSSRTGQAEENARDRALMARAASGDRDALEQLFKLYNRRVYRSCLHTCRNADDAMEATQEAFLAVFKRMRDYHASISSFRDYLFMASRNACLKIISKRGLATSVVQAPESVQREPVDATEDPVRSLLISDQQQIVRGASFGLKARQLEALKMYELDGMGYSEIGRKLGIEANAVSQLISRARKKLRTEVRNKSAVQRSSTEICARALKLMPKRVDAALSAREAAWLDQHIGSCQTCETNLNMIEEIGTSYRSLVPPTAILFERIFSDEALTKIFPRVAGAGSTVATRIVRSTGFLALGGKLAAATSTLVVVFTAGLVAVNSGGEEKLRGDLARQAAVSKASKSKSRPFTLGVESRKTPADKDMTSDRDTKVIEDIGQASKSRETGNKKEGSRSSGKSKEVVKKSPESQIPEQVESGDMPEPTNDGADSTSGAEEGGVAQPQEESTTNESPENPAEAVDVAEPSQGDRSKDSSEGYAGPPRDTEGGVWHTYSKSAVTQPGSDSTRETGL